jgi:hypothetical protein
MVLSRDALVLRVEARCALVRFAVEVLREDDFLEPFRLAR